MYTVRALIDTAAEMCGSQAALARHLGVHPHRVCEWKSGVRSITPEQIAELCLLLRLSGDDCRCCVALSIIASAKNTERRDRLREAFFRSGHSERRRCTDRPPRRSGTHHAHH